jgi:hypothetical protein
MARSPCLITRCAILNHLNDGPAALLYRNLTTLILPRGTRRLHGIRSGADLKSP